MGNRHKAFRRTLRSDGGHWVGDGFPVRTLFEYSSHGAELSPFLLLDYGGPVVFEPTKERRGVGAHPHRGFETVTIVYDGEVEHRDSSGGGGRIGPGDVQWMTAASGLVHEEFHGRDFAARGGRFEMVQLWVNLPAKDKMAKPGYQAIVAKDIPTAALPGGRGTARVIAGRAGDARGPAKTFTPIEVHDLRLLRGAPIELPVPDGHTTALVVLRGHVRTDGTERIGDAEVALFERGGTSIVIEPVVDTTALLLAGAPIAEPIVGRGPFVMNTAQEIRTAIEDFAAGRLGELD